MSTIRRTYRDSVLASVHETAEGLLESGLMDKRTMRRFNKLCLIPVTPEEIPAIRLQERLAKQSYRSTK
jgi:putative transcriptional regulator